VEHYLLKLLDDTDGDLAPSEALRGGFDAPAAGTDSQPRQTKRGNAGRPVFSVSLVNMLKEAWAIGKSISAPGRLRTGFTILALAATDDLARLMGEVSPKEFGKIQPDASEGLPTIVGASHEDSNPRRWPRRAQWRERARARARDRVPRSGEDAELDAYTVDLTAKAKAGNCDPVLGRDHEIRQMVDILMRRRQNNPILTGEAGVGKSAVVEGFAQRVAAGDVPPPLKGVGLRSLDLALLQAGAGVKANSRTG